MGYSRSPVTIHRRRQLIRRLLEGHNRVVWNSSMREAPDLARQIRECFHVAKLYPQEFKALAEAAELYIIKVEGSKVVGHRRETVEIPEKLDPMPAGILSAFTSAEIIQAWLDHMPSTAPLRFHADLSPEDFGEVVRWAGSMEPPWEVIRGGKVLTLRPEGVSL